MKRYMIHYPGSMYSLGPIEASSMSAARKKAAEMTDDGKLPRGTEVYETESRSNPGPDYFTTADGKKHLLSYSAAISGGDRAVIRSRVGKMHVSTPDEDVRQDIFWRIPEKVRKAHPQAVKLAMRYAVECHHKNQKMYRRVMSGRL